jgi:uncharacterized membrane protein (DUF485 family)
MSDAADPQHQDHPSLVTRNARYGMVLFVAYLIIYGGFVILSAFKPDLMKKPLFEGVNVAVAYGMFLIIAAFVLAVIYMALCAMRGSEGRQ